ncbi:MAG: hypothetical protein KAG95_03080 [Bacteroidales bacterium]|nr:hypothetical protein [Bacteroidales bacterium]
MEDNNAFRDNLDKLIELFKKIKEKSKDKYINDMDKSFLMNFDMLINNYEMIKNNVPDEVLNEMGEPIKEYISEMIEKMKAELGEEFKDDIETVNEIIEIENSIEQIDKLLENPKLSDNEINELLDKRKKIKVEKKGNK